MEYINRKELSARAIDSFHTFNSNFFQKISYPIAANHWISLCILDSYGPSTATALGHHLSISKQQVRQIINKLCKDGYISRQTALNDRRCKNITLTEKGHKVIMNEIRLLTLVFENKIDILADLELTKFDEAIKTFVPLFEKIYIINKETTQQTKGISTIFEINKTKTLTLYIRVSADDQQERKTIEAQFNLQKIL